MESEFGIGEVGNLSPLIVSMEFIFGENGVPEADEAAAISIKYQFTSEEPIAEEGLCTATIMSDGENVELSCSSQDEGKDENLLPGWHTPLGSIFDPFAPAPDDAAFAPKKVPRKNRNLILSGFESCSDSNDAKDERRLDFDSHSDSDDAAEDERILESMSASLFEAVVANYIVEIDKEKGGLFEFSLETPTSLPNLTSVEETCPDAPLKPDGIRKIRSIASICRKLEF